MDKKQAKNRIEKLKKEINYHRYIYHVLDKQEISDDALDSLKKELFDLEQKYPDLITKDSPTQRIGGKPLDKFLKVKHSSQMLSLFDAFSPQDMKDWQDRILRILKTSSSFHLKDLDYFCELKLDGLAVSLKYEKNLFIQGATRGDGKIGEDVTNNLKTIESIPLSLNMPEENDLKKINLDNKEIKKLYKIIKQDNVEVRGEVIMSKDVWKKLNAKYKKEGRAILANPRNGAAGSIRQLDPKLAAERKLEFYAYDLIIDLELATQEQKMQLVKLLGFKTLKYNKKCADLEEVIKLHDNWEKVRDTFSMEVDGMVVKVNKLFLWPVLGIVGKGPRYMIAYKFSGKQATTKLLDVVWQVGRTGVLTPTAILKPVHINGVTISRATLHNMDEIKKLDIKIGDTVIIERAGDVIPKIIKAIPKLRDGKEKNIKSPSRCPICGSKVEKIPGEVAYRCVNKECYAINLRQLIHWASKGAANIEGLGPNIIKQLVKKGLVRDVSDFYNLKAGDLKPLEKFAEKSAQNLVNSINSSKEIELARFIYALGIRHIGEESAIELANNFGDLEKIKKASLEDFENIYDFGNVMAKSVYEWFHNDKNLRLLQKLKEAGIIIKNPQNIHKNKNFINKTFVLTGSLKSLTRDQAKDKIRELGGKISSSVSNKTDFVIIGAAPGNKYDKAKKLGVKILTENEFLKLI